MLGQIVKWCYLLDFPTKDVTQDFYTYASRAKSAQSPRPLLRWH